MCVNEGWAAFHPTGFLLMTARQLRTALSLQQALGEAEDQVKMRHHIKRRGKREGGGKKKKTETVHLGSENPPPFSLAWT